MKPPGSKLPQHDHHCWITFMGVNWRIWQIRSKRFIYLWREGQPPIGVSGWTLERTVMDIGHVDFDAYCRAANEWDYRR
jgi:hypothetical protein